MDFKWKYQFNGILPRRKAAAKEQNVNEVLKEKLPYQIVFKQPGDNDSQTWIGRKLAGVNDIALSQFIIKETNPEQPRNLQTNSAVTSAAQQREDSRIPTERPHLLICPPETRQDSSVLTLSALIVSVLTTGVLIYHLILLSVYTRNISLQVVNALAILIHLASIASLKYPGSILPVVISRLMSLCYAVYFGMILSRPVDVIITSVSLIQYIVQSLYIQSKKLKLLVLPGQF